MGRPGSQSDAPSKDEPCLSAKDNTYSLPEDRTYSSPGDKSPAKKDDGDNIFDFIFPEFYPKSNCYTRKSKYPRSTHLDDFRDWTKCPLGNCNRFEKPLRPFFPLPPEKRFLPLDSSISEEKAMMARADKGDPRGTRTPWEAVHFGWRKFSLDPTYKRLRKFNDPIPSPPDTTKRASYFHPEEKSHLLFRQNITRYGCNPRPIALGIVPCTLSIPPEPIKDTSWSKDFVYKPRVEKPSKPKHPEYGRIKLPPLGT